MEANFFDFVPNLSSGGDYDMPWCDNDFVLSYQRAVAEAEKGSSDDFLQIAPNWRQAQILKKIVEDQIKDLQSDDTGIGTVAAGVALVAGWIVAALTRRN